MSKRDKQLLVIIIALVMMLVVVLIGAFFYSKEKLGHKEYNSKTEIEKSIIIDDESLYEEFPADGLEIETLAGTIYYQAKWEEYTIIEKTKENDGEIICFFAKIGDKETVPLFTLNFGVAKGNYFGTVKINGETIKLYFEVFELYFSDIWNDSEKNLVYSMQEGMNGLLAQLNVEEEEHGEVLDTNNNEMLDEKNIEIETPYGNLNFPGRWKEYLYTEINDSTDYTVKFYAKIPNKDFVSLFDISFGNETEDSFGEVLLDDGKKINVNIKIYDFIPNDAWSDSEIDIIFEMQEAFNDIVGSIVLKE